jgi:diphosphomevalonate decarboxylase
MNNQIQVIKKIIPSTFNIEKKEACAFAPSNIALCKYWGKRDEYLNLPATSSLSISLGSKGAFCKIVPLKEAREDLIHLNEKLLPMNHIFTQQILNYLSFFRRSGKNTYQIQFNLNIPVAAGLASSACIFAALIQALNALHQWKLKPSELSILARLGSGSASRSLWKGFVKWQAGEDFLGMDSHGIPLEEKWPELCIGLYILSQAKKPISSREAMKKTINTAVFYKSWPEKVAKDLSNIEDAISKKDFEQLGSTTESNALSLHALMANAVPAIVYSLPETLACMHHVWHLRQEGIPVFFTQDAGPNLKLFFLEKDEAIIKSAFPKLEVIKPFQEKFDYA